MAKKIKVIVAQGLKIGGKYPPLGTELDLDVKEAHRLLDLGAVEFPKPKIAASEAQNAPEGAVSTTPPPTDEAALIAQINTSASLEELQALLTEEQPSEVVAAAAEARWVALEAEGK